MTDPAVKPTLVLDLDRTLVYKMVRRPGLEKFLEEMVKVYKIVVFTMRPPESAVAAMQWLDPKRKYIVEWFDRSHCARGQFDSGEVVFLKHLEAHTADMKRTIWLDDVGQNYCHCPNNGLVVKAFCGEVDDSELEKLTPLLLALANSENVVQDIRDWKAGLLELTDGKLVKKGGKIVQTEQRTRKGPVDTVCCKDGGTDGNSSPQSTSKLIIGWIAGLCCRTDEAEEANRASYLLQARKH